MFWGAIVKEGKPWKAVKNMEDAEYPVLHISQAALPKSAQAGKIQLTLSNGKDLKDLVVCTLQKEKVENQSLDLYIHISQPIELKVSGPGEIHLSGYVEPSQDMEDNEFMQGGDLDDEEDSEEEMDEQRTKDKRVKDNIKAAQANAKQNSRVKDEESDSEDDDGFQLDGELDDLEDDEDEEAEDSEEEAPRAVPVPKGKQSVTKQAAIESDSEDDDDVLAGGDSDEEFDSDDEPDLAALMAKNKKNKGSNNEQ
jgi:hypothetical protein